MKKSPVVLITSNVANVEGTPAHIVKNPYIRPLVELLNCTPLLIPAIGELFDLKSIGDFISGILITGSSSHVAPSYYGAQLEFEDRFIDEKRDTTTLPLLKSAIDLDIPVFAICRGFQELNVICGGTLHQHIHKIEDKLDHYPLSDQAREQQYEHLAHGITVQKGGLFEKIGLPHEFRVNSIHTQAVDKIGKGLQAEAFSEDGFIEGVSMPDKRFIIGTQWHPEGDFYLNPVSAKLFEAFRDAIHA